MESVLSLITIHSPLRSPHVQPDQTTSEYIICSRRKSHHSRCFYNVRTNLTWFYFQQRQCLWRCRVRDAFLCPTSTIRTVWRRKTLCYATRCDALSPPSGRKTEPTEKLQNVNFKEAATPKLHLPSASAHSIDSLHGCPAVRHGTRLRIFINRSSRRSTRRQTGTPERQNIQSRRHT